MTTTTTTTTIRENYDTIMDIYRALPTTPEFTPLRVKLLKQAKALRAQTR